MRLRQGSGNGAVVRELTSQGCGLELASHVSWVCCRFSSSLCEFFLQVLRFPTLQKILTFPKSTWPGNSGQEEPPRGMSTPEFIFSLSSLCITRPPEINFFACFLCFYGAQTKYTLRGNASFILTQTSQLHCDFKESMLTAVVQSLLKRAKHAKLNNEICKEELRI